MTLKIVDGGKSPSAGKQFASEDNDGNEDTAGANVTIDRRRLFKPVLPAMLHKHNALAIVVRCDEEWMGSFSVSADELDRASLIDSVKQLLSAKEFRDKMRLKGCVMGI